MTLRSQHKERNWGRWGTEDRRGAVNLLTPDVVARSLQLPASGRIISLATPVGKRGVITGGRNQTWHLTIQVADPARPGSGRAEDTLTMHTHAHTHLDGLAHVWYDGAAYNGVSPTTISRGGSRELGIDHVGPIVGRGVLYDVTLGGRRTWSAGEAIDAAAMGAARDHAGVTPESGDIVLVHTGWYAKEAAGDRVGYTAGEPGLGPEGLDWVVESDPSLVGMDCWGIEPIPALDGVSPMLNHETLLRDCGVGLLENLDLGELADAAPGPFLFVATPLSITHGLGSPMAPIAIL